MRLQIYRVQLGSVQANLRGWTWSHKMLHSHRIPVCCLTVFIFCLPYFLLRLRRSQSLPVAFYHLDPPLFLTPSVSNLLQAELVLLYPSLCGLALGSRSLGWYRWVLQYHLSR